VSPDASPSIVVIFLPSASLTEIPQERMATPDRPEQRRIGLHVEREGFSVDC
jgi:hypothetical protein